MCIRDRPPPAVLAHTCGGCRAEERTRGGPWSHHRATAGAGPQFASRRPCGRTRCLARRNIAAR
eukprot:10102635-Alexandrium_andersonii.AAC.1